MQSEGTFFGLAVSFEYTFNFKFRGALFREVHKQNATVLLGRELLAEMLHMNNSPDSVHCTFEI